MTTTANQYIDRVASALNVNRQNLFPFDRHKRKAQNLRLGREVGYGLADFDESARRSILSTLYSRLIVVNSFDSTGVVIDSGEFVDALQQGMEKARIYSRRTL